MYKVNLTFSNPMTNDSEVLELQFEKDSLDQAKWNGAFNDVKASLAKLVTRSSAKEPPTW